jgi:glucose/arabinose dehydrogenase
MNRAERVLALVLVLCGATANAQVALEDAFPALPAFSLPVELVHPGDGSDRLFVVEQKGRIYSVQTSPAAARRVFIDLSDIVSQGGGEMGLLGLAFHPSYRTNGLFYVDYTSSRTGSLKSYVSQFQTSPGDPDSALRASEVVLLTADQPYENHNGGKIAFGPDGHLYISLGDGGSGNDPGNNGQSRTTLLGKILRIDVDTQTPPLPYGIPPSNPWSGNTQGFRQEIFAYGLRNPWKFSFDAFTGTLWAGDVGQNAREEIDTIVAGGNYGWRLMEGMICTPGANPGCQDTAGLIRPVWDYAHGAGDISVTGGYVYRGTSIPTLAGKYVYGDFGSGRIWALSAGGGAPATNELLLDSPVSISTFGVDRKNELFVVAYSNGRIYRLTGPAAAADLPPAAQAFELQQNFPNPFNPVTTIRYGIPTGSAETDVRLTVYDLLGREVAVLVNTRHPAGTYEVNFDASRVASGVYLYRLSAGDLVQTRAMLLLK